MLMKNKNSGDFEKWKDQSFMTDEVVGDLSSAVLVQVPFDCSHDFHEQSRIEECFVG